MFGIYIAKYSTFKLKIQPDLLAHNEAIDQFLADFEADRATTANSFLSMPNLAGANAAEDLNSKISWSFADDSPAVLSIPESSLKKINEADSGWIELGPDVFQDLDFSWLTKNFAYNHWSIWNSNRIKKHFASSDHTSTDLPMPDYDQLLSWAKLRYLHGLYNNDLLAAQSEIRHLALLIESQEHHAATKTALSIFALEADIAKTSGAKTSDFIPISDVLLRKVTAMLTYYESAAHPFTRDDLVRKIVAFREPHFGLCGVLSNYAWIRAVDIHRPIPFKDTNKLLDSFAKTTSCRREYEDYLYQAPRVTAFLEEHPFFSKMANHKFSYFLFKDTIGLIIDKSSLTDGALVYRKERTNAG